MIEVVINPLEICRLVNVTEDGRIGKWGKLIDVAVAWQPIKISDIIDQITTKSDPTLTRKV